jgi:16S rRNA (cytosine1402-N4)-methyltransferase
MQDFHQSVMPDKVIKYLDCKPGKVYVDCTLGGAGHSALIASSVQPDGVLVAMDVDEDAINYAKQVLDPFNNVYIVKSNFVDLSFVLDCLKIDTIDGGVIADLGVSSFQITSPERGFSIYKDSKLDMRMDKDLNDTAYDLINTMEQSELVEIFKTYGEERYSNRIARAIVLKRKESNIETTAQLASLIKSVVPGSQKTQIHPATRVFQALRIAVNKELDVLQQLLTLLVARTAPGARIAIISFHSLEDRIVKNFFRHESLECVCSPKLAVCNCNHKTRLKIITRKPLIPDDAELKRNPSSRSAKLRVAERL